MSKVIYRREGVIESGRPQQSVQFCVAWALAIRYVPFPLRV